MRNIFLIGAGNIGTRTLQSLIQSKFVEDSTFWIVDPFRDSLELAKQRVGEVGVHDVEIKYLTDISQLPEYCELAIVATVSGPRLNICKQLLGRVKVDVLILEKFLFQKLNDYNEFEHISSGVGKVYVNCPRQTWPGYVWLKDQLINENKIDVSIDGSNWALASNAIHFISMFKYISDANAVDVTNSGLDKTVVDNKRQGYKEVTGVLTAKTVRGDCLTLNSRANGDKALSILVKTPSSEYAISEQNQICSLYSGGALARSVDFGILRASEMSADFNELYYYGKSNLPSYDDVRVEHLQLISILNNVFYSTTSDKSTICPIT